MTAVMLKPNYSLSQLPLNYGLAGWRHSLGKLKFGVFLPFYAFQTERTQAQHFSLIRDTVLECERLGYDSVWLDDHLMYNDWPILECWTTLSSALLVNQQDTVGNHGFLQCPQKPSFARKDGCDVDVLSNGRLELGIGAGIQETEHIAYGFGFPQAKRQNRAFSRGFGSNKATLDASKSKLPRKTLLR